MPTITSPALSHVYQDVNMAFMRLWTLYRDMARTDMQALMLRMPANGSEQQAKRPAGKFLPVRRNMVDDW